MVGNSCFHFKTVHSFGFFVAELCAPTRCFLLLARSLIAGPESQARTEQLQHFIQERDIHAMQIVCHVYPKERNVHDWCTTAGSMNKSQENYPMYWLNIHENN